ncbi:hypothetical protein LXL04_026029 [Taraxacum kok-saghyz]
MADMETNENKLTIGLIFKVEWSEVAATTRLRLPELIFIITVDSLEHGEHGLVIVVIKKPNAGILFVFLKRHYTTAHVHLTQNWVKMVWLLTVLIFIRNLNNVKGEKKKIEGFGGKKSSSMCKKFVFKLFGLVKITMILEFTNLCFMVRTCRTEVKKFQVLEKGLCRPENTGRVTLGHGSCSVPNRF